MLKRLLICDDDQDIVEMLEIVLDDPLIEVFTETDSKRMIDLIVSTKPDMVLMDLWMPIVSGDQVLRQIRLHHQFRDLPVIIMSAAQDGRDVAANAGADDYISKPFDIDKLLLKVHKMMGV